MSAYNKIQQNIYKFIRKHFLNELFKGIILFVVFGFFYIFITALVEYFFWLPSSGRQYLYYAQWIVLFIFFIFFILRPLLNLLGIKKELSDEKAAVIIGNFFPEIKDKLLNTLQLHHQSEFSDLLLASIEQKSNELNKFSFSKAVNFKRNYKYLPLLLIPFIVLAVLRITHFDQEITQGYRRVLSYKEKFTPPLPYSIELTDSLSVLKSSDFTLKIKLKGSEFPDRLFIRFEKENHRLKKLNDSIYSFYFPLIQEPLSFDIYDAKHHLGHYRIQVLYPPVLQNFQIELIYPAYLHKSNKILSFASNIIVPQSTLIKWHFKTEHTDSIYFSINNKDSIYSVHNNNFSFHKRAVTDFTYKFQPINKYLRSSHSNLYKVEVIQDEFPKIHVLEKKDTLNRQNYYRINASDDYGLTQLVLVYTNRKTGESHTTHIKKLRRDFTSVNYIFPGDLSLSPGIPYEYYFQIYDNDAVHHYKSSKSKTFYYNNLTDKQLEELNLHQQQQNLARLNEFQHKFSKQKENLNKIQSKITAQKSMDWQSKKLLVNTIQQAEQQEEFFKQALKKYEELLDKLPDDKQLNNKKELQERLKELAQMKKKKQILDELKKLADKLQKEDLIDKLKDLDKYSEHQEKSLERILELTKKYYMQQKMKKLSEQLDSLSQKQSELAQKNTDTSKEQDSLNQQLQAMQKQMDSLQKMNQALTKPMKIPDNSTEMEEIQMDMQKASQQLQQQQSQMANQQQNKAARKMKQLSKNMMSMMMGGGQEQQKEDIKTLQALLKSLLNFSFKEENLLTNLYHQNSQHNLSQHLLTQNSLRTYFKHINDSLYTLALRNPKISQTILDEAFEIQVNMDKVLSYLSENQSYNTQNAAQYILKGANTLADFLSNTLDNMKNAMQAIGQGQGKSGKGESFSLPDIIKKQSDAISKMQQGMKQGQKQGNKGKDSSKNGKQKGKKSGKEQSGNDGKPDSQGESARQYELYKQQQRIKEDLQQLGDKFSDQATQQKIKDITKQMEDLQKRLLHEGITQSTLNKMIKLQHELLKLKNATFTQHEDDKRQSRTNFKAYKGIDSLFFRENFKILPEDESLKRSQIPVNQKVKKKIHQYLN